MENPHPDQGKSFIDLLLKCHRVAKGLALSARLPLDELYCLAVIHTASPSCVKELSRLLGVRGPRTSKLLGSLERKGYLRRTLNVTDHRMEELALTDQGTRVVESVLRISKGILEKLQKPGHPECMQQLLLLLEEMPVPEVAREYGPAFGGHPGWFVLPEEE